MLWLSSDLMDKNLMERVLFAIDVVGASYGAQKFFFRSSGLRVR